MKQIIKHPNVDPRLMIGSLDDKMFEIDGTFIVETIDGSRHSIFTCHDDGRPPIHMEGSYFDSKSKYGIIYTDPSGIRWRVIPKAEALEIHRDGGEVYKIIEPTLILQCCDADFEDENLSFAIHE